MARGYNMVGEHADARRVCEEALSYVTEDDREYVMHFLTLDLELAVANAALGLHADALASIDARIERYRLTDHRLALGLLHETRARIAWGCGKTEVYRESLAETKRCFLPTREPSLIAKYSRLAELGAGDAAPVVVKEPRVGADDDRIVSSAEQQARTVVSGRRAPTSS
jgi:hypothetical protein